MALGGGISKIKQEGSFGAMLSAFSFMQQENPTAAYEVFVKHQQEFVNVPLYSYYAACIAATLGRVDEARSWLRKAFAEITNEKERRKLLTRAFVEPNLAPLWTSDVPAFEEASPIS